MKLTKTRPRTEHGSSTVEYALVTALVAFMAITVFGFLAVVAIDVNPTAAIVAPSQLSP